MPFTTQELLDYDRQHIWHPYSSIIDPPPMYPVVAASGVHIELADGRKLIDGMASWWSAIHGYNHPVLNQALQDQAASMAHVMFGGLTHPAAVNLAKRLIDITPASLQKVFFSDSGSVAVEVAIKMALQYCHAEGERDKCKVGKTKLLSLQSGYHGDTFGAMAVCDPITGMHHLFSDAMTKHYFWQSPCNGFAEHFDETQVNDFKNQLENHHQEIAAVILEPIVQGAGGMKFYNPGYLKRIRELCTEFDVLLIADEIATGFGRSGKLFACEHAEIEPDIMCIGKSLTGGYMTLAATLCNDKVANGICQGKAGVFMHGPTFMANPLACAVAGASIDLLLSQDWQAIISNIEKQLTIGLAAAKNLPMVADVRVLGAIGVIEMKEAVDMRQIQPMFVEAGVWVRPFGKLVYVMPPYVISDDQLMELTNAMVEVVGCS